MLSSILNFILFLAFIYLFLYGIYLLTINLKALLSRKKFLNGEYFSVNEEEFKKNKICVVIWANSKSKKLEGLLRSLNEQTYLKENYSVHVVYAKDSNSLLYTPDCMAGAQIHCIENPEFFNKNKALNTFLSKLVVGSKFDIYLFLGADRYVNQYYLENINYSFNTSNTKVITGKTTVVPEFKNHLIRAKILETRQEFKNNTTNVARRMFSLFSVIDSDNCAIASDILEKTGRVCFETREDELKYSLFLASNNIAPVYSPFMETIVEAQDFNPTSASLGIRYSLFKYYLKLLFKKPWNFVEFVLSLLYPNVAVIVLLFITIFYASFNFISSIEHTYILHLIAFYLLVWTLGIIASSLGFKRTILFMIYPFYSFAFNFKKITKDISRRAIQKSISEEKNIKSATMDAIVTDGSKEVMCKMDLISDNGMRRVILRFRKKHVISEESIRMYDAVQNISKKVKTHGYTLKICQNCSHFKITPDGTVDLLKGKCFVNTTPDNPDETFETLIWNTCNCFVPHKGTDVLDVLNNENKN